MLTIPAEQRPYLNWINIALHDWVGTVNHRTPWISPSDSFLQTHPNPTVHALALHAPQRQQTSTFHELPPYTPHDRLSVSFSTKATLGEHCLIDTLSVSRIDCKGLPVVSCLRSSHAKQWRRVRRAVRKGLRFIIIVWIWSNNSPSQEWAARMRDSFLPYHIENEAVQVALRRILNCL